MAIGGFEFCTLPYVLICNRSLHVSCNNTSSALYLSVKGYLLAALQHYP